MKRQLALIILAIGLVVSACSSATSETPSEEVAPATTTTTVAPAPAATEAFANEAPTTTDGRSPLAELVAPVGSAAYDPRDHVDDRPVPTSISIDRIGVSEAPVLDVGVRPDGEMEIPGASDVGWYRFNPTPGEAGSAVLAAHIQYNGKPGVFRYLSDVEIGDEVVVHFDDGSQTGFRIVELAQYDKDELPTDRVFAKDGDPVLTLITCGGDFNRSLNSYEDNVVAYAVPISA
jgi:LPXTG-site transpeptidase (sortase) family protein